MLPVSSYEELLVRVRNLTSETIQLQRELASSLFQKPCLEYPTVQIKNNLENHGLIHLTKETLANEKQTPGSIEESFFLRENIDQSYRPDISVFPKKNKKYITDTIKKSQGISPGMENLTEKNDWNLDNIGLWHSGPSTVYSNLPTDSVNEHQDSASLICYNYCEGSKMQSFENFSSPSRTYSHQQLGVKVEMVYNLLSMLDTNNHDDMSKTFLAMSSSAESCHAMRQSGCLPLLIQLIHSSDLDIDVRHRAAEALQNIVEAQTDEKRRRREMRVLKLLQQIREYCHDLKNSTEKTELHPESLENASANADKHPLTAMGALMKFSFDADHRQAICTLGGLHVIAELIQVDLVAHGNSENQIPCVTLRRYAGMSLTNLTFGDGKNKSLLCSFTKFMRALVDQLQSPSEDLRQVTASVLRNLSWRADTESKQALREVGAVTALTVTAMDVKKESTLKSILSALWNLSAHCSMNKVDICNVPGALAFLVSMLKYKSASNTLGIVENAGGIIRNISSHIAVREDYRQILRDNNCFEVLLEHLRSPSLTIVSNACGTLWNLSARCSEDQRRLWEMGATTMLRSLIQSKHKMISMGSSAALKNLMTANPNGNLMSQVDSTAKCLGFQNLPTLFARKQRALEQELNITLAETCDNIEPSESPTLKNNKSECNGNKVVFPKRSDSHESIKSTLSDSVCERINQKSPERETDLLHNKNISLHQSLNENQAFRKSEDEKYIKRYRTSLIPTFAPKKINLNKSNEKNEENVPVKDVTTTKCNEADLTRKAEHSLEKDSVRRAIPVLKSRPRSKIVSVVDNKFFDCGNDGKMEEKNSNLAVYKNEKSETLNLNTSLSQEPESASLVTERTIKVFSESESFLGCFKNSSELRSDNLPVICSTQRSSLNMAKTEDEVLEDQKNCEFNYSKIDSTLENDCMTEENKNTENGHPIPSYSFLHNGENNPKKGLNDTLVSAHSLYEENLIESCSENFSENCLNEIINENNEKNNFKICVADNDSLKKTKEISFPDFKVGIEVIDSKVLRYEANKICREIQKFQESHSDMGYSLNSDISLVSCSSFLDAGDCSIFDCSSNVIDFEDGENISNSKASNSINNFACRKPLVCQIEEPVSLPSLGSLKNEQIEAIDLEGSIISIASITSEIAETSLKDKNIDTYTKTYKNDLGIESWDETIADSAVLSNEEDTINGEPSRIDLDDDNSLKSQENLPVDSVQTETKVFRSSEKLTPKDKRKLFHERYRTYTILDSERRIIGNLAQTNITPAEEKSNVNISLNNDFVASLIESSKVLGKNDNRENDEKKIKEKDFYNEIQNSANSHFAYEMGNKKIQYEDLKNGVTLDIFNSEGKSFEFMKASKSFDENFDHLSTRTPESRSLDDLLSIGPIERKELVDNAKLVAFSLKTAVQEMDSDTSSDYDLEENCRTLTIDTATYNKKEKINICSTISKKEFKNSICDFYGGNALEKLQTEGPKILKPQEKGKSEKLENFSKTIRGRRKLLYSSGLSKRGNISTPNSPKTRPTFKKVEKPNLTATKSLPNVSKSNYRFNESLILHREGTFTKERGSTDETLARNSRAIPVFVNYPEAKRSSSVNFSGRNKFTAKSKNTRCVSETSKNAKIGLVNYSKNYDKTNNFNASKKKEISIDTGSKMKGVSGKAGKVFASPGLSLQEPKNLSANQNPKGNQSFQGIYSLKAKNSASSNCEASINVYDSDNVSFVDKEREKTQKYEVASKIVSLWKKVEETKKKAKDSSDNKVWINSGGKGKIQPKMVCVEQEEILDISSQKIVHSHTCHGLSEKSTKNSAETNPVKEVNMKNRNF